MENIIFCGLGKVGKVICEDFLKRKDIKVCNKFISLEKNNIKIKNKTFYPISLNELKKIKKDFIIIDFTLPTCVNENINFYLKNNINFVCGTTGVDFNNLNKKIKKSKSVCVVAPNMGKEIVVFMSMFEFASKNFKNSFKDYTMQIIESHQKGKIDTSGTAKKMVEYFNELGIKFNVKQIKKIREEKNQEKLNIPKKYLKGHAYHTYRLVSKDKTVLFEFKHNINGRKIYCGGVYAAVNFLHKNSKSKKGKVYSMIDVLKG